MRWMFVWILFAAAGSSVLAEEFTKVEVDAGKIVKQQLYGDSSVACGPTSMINVLRFGTPEMRQTYASLVGSDDRARLRYVIDRYFKNKQSVIYPREKRFGHHGVFPADLGSAFNDLLREHQLKEVAWQETDRDESENDRDFLERVHNALEQSLAGGVPPIVQLRTFAAMQEEDGSRKVVWKATNNHYLVVTRVPSRLRKEDMGFVFDAVDPNGGRLVSGYVYGEGQQPFRAERAATDPRDPEWLSGRPFLLVAVPGATSLRPSKAIWRDRVIVTLSAVVGRYWFSK